MGRRHGPGNRFGWSGSVPGPSTAVRKGVTPKPRRLISYASPRSDGPLPRGNAVHATGSGRCLLEFVEDADRHDRARGPAGQPPAKARRPLAAAWNVEVGGSGGYGRMGLRPARPAGRNSPAVAVAVAPRSEAHPSSRVAQARPTPPRSGTCLLRRVAGSATPLAGSRNDDAPESGWAR